MTTRVSSGEAGQFEFTLPTALEAHEPPEAKGLARDRVRLLVSSSDGVSHHRFTDLPSLLRAGDVLVVNTSATMPAAVPVPDSGLVVHFSTEQPSGTWLVELRAAAWAAGVWTDEHGGRREERARGLRAQEGRRRAEAHAPPSGARQSNTEKAPHRDGQVGERYPLPGGGSVTLRRSFSAGRLWESDVDTLGRGVPEYLSEFGVPIRYSYVTERWPLSCYQTVFGVTPGSAEMPSASRPFTDRLVTRLVAAGVQFAPVLLHTGVASPEAHERPYPERFAVPSTTRDLVDRARAEGRRVIGVGTTAVRAIESDGDDGWTDVIITPSRGVHRVDGLLTGFHEPKASHLDMLAAIAGPDLLHETYRKALAAGYLWHEFGDVNLILP